MNLMSTKTQAEIVFYNIFKYLFNFSSLTTCLICFQALGVFGLCQIHAFVDFVRSRMSPENFGILFKALVSTIVTIVLVVGAILTITGKVSPWTGRFYSLLDPSYAKNHIPIIASVSEHQPTSWSSFYFDLQVSLM